MEFSRQTCWSGLPFPSPGNFPKPGIEPGSPALQADSLLSEPPGKPKVTSIYNYAYNNIYLLLNIKYYKYNNIYLLIIFIYNINVLYAYILNVYVLYIHFKFIYQFSSVAQSCPTLCNPMNCSTPGLPVHPNPCPLSRWYHPAISSSVVPFSSCPQSFPASGSFQMSQLFTSGGQSIGVSVSASVLPVNTQDWFPLGWTGWISL